MDVKHTIDINYCDDFIFNKIMSLELEHKYLDYPFDKWLKDNYNARYIEYSHAVGIWQIDFYDSEKYVEFCLRWL